MTASNRWQSIVSAGCEGGGLDIQGRKRSDGTWELQTHSSGIGMDDDDNVVWREHTCALASLADGFEDIDGSFFLALTPTRRVHPEFRAEMLAILEAYASPSSNATRPPSEDEDATLTDRREQRRASWLEACTGSGPLR